MAREIAALSRHDCSYMKDRLRIGLLLAIVAMIYGNILVNQFVMDDELYIVRNAQVVDPTLRGLFSPNIVQLRVPALHVCHICPELETQWAGTDRIPFV